MSEVFPSAKMDDNTKMRDEFEKWAKARELPITTIHWENGLYSFTDPRTAWAFEGYRAGQEAIQKEALQQLADEAQELDMGY